MEYINEMRTKWAYDDPLATCTPLKALVQEHVVPLLPLSWQKSPMLNDNLHTLLFSFTLYNVMYFVGDALLYLPFFHRNLIKPKDRIDLAVKFVSFWQSVIICILGIPVYNNDNLNYDHVFANTPYTGFYVSMALGYFIWDAIICAYFVKYGGIGFVMHGVVSTIVFGIASHYKFIHYYSAIFLLFEISTPFLNIRWFGLKLKVLPNLLELLNNIILILIFFFIRILWGWYQVGMLGIDFYAAKDDPRFTLWGACVILFCNGVLDILNVFWFSKMLTVAITTLKQMFGFAEKNKDDEKLKLM